MLETFMIFKIVTLHLQSLPCRIKLVILGFFTIEREWEKKKKKNSLLHATWLGYRLAHSAVQTELIYRNGLDSKASFTFTNSKRVTNSSEFTDISDERTCCGLAMNYEKTEILLLGNVTPTPVNNDLIRRT